MRATTPLSVREKHFLDTSVTWPLLAGSTTYRQHLETQFAPNAKYVSVYVQMEMRRSFIQPAIAFYSLLQLPSILSVQDALNLWSNEFKPRRLKFMIHFVADLMRTHSLDFNDSADKEKASIALANYIIRFEAKLRRSFKDPGQDTTRCTRALIPLRFHAENLSSGLEQFAEQFDDTEHCRNNCSIDYVLLRRYSKEVQRIIDVSKSTPDNNATHGFLAVANQLATVVKKGADACSCHRCEKIGDAVIALETPRQMLLEHLDNSFNYLCPPLAQRHRQHESEIAFHKAQSPKQPV